MKSATYSCMVGFALASPPADVLEKFDEFQAKWGHRYVGTEYNRRSMYFSNQLDRITELQKQEQGTATYSYLGPFTDFSPDEMAQMTGLLTLGEVEDAEFAQSRNETLPNAFDWVSKGAVNEIKNQGQCGSCWSFSTACNLEGTGFVTDGRLVSVSEQNIMDCDKTCYSCNGGLPSLALAWSARNGGVASEEVYPYKAHNEPCYPTGKIVQNKGWMKISRNEDQIAQQLVHYGPLSIAVDASPFQTYTGGIMKNPSCSKTKLDHAINIVGYGSASIKYWKLRNSWGKNWGEAGYIRVSRGDCTCGLCTQVVTATGVSVSSTPSPIPPSPPYPTPSPTVCKDHYSKAKCEIGKDFCFEIATVCLETCGCCVPNPPGWCSGPVSSSAVVV